MTLSGPLSSWCGMTFWKCWSTVRKQRQDKCHTPINKLLSNNYVPWHLNQVFLWPQSTTSNVSMYTGTRWEDTCINYLGVVEVPPLRVLHQQSKLLKCQVMWRLWCYTCNIPSMSSWMSSVWFIWRMARPTRKTISRPWRKRSPVITEESCLERKMMVNVVWNVFLSGLRI